MSLQQNSRPEFPPSGEGVGMALTGNCANLSEGKMCKILLMELKNPVEFSISDISPSTGVLGLA